MTTATQSIDLIDLHWLGVPQAVGSFIVRGGDATVMIECGPASTRDAIEKGLRDLGLTPGDIDHLLVTHVHLDHAGGAWWVAEQGATVHVHEVGAPHLIDPSKLIASAGRIYGEALENMWGDIKPIPEKQVNPLRDGDVIEAGPLRFTALDTPGHADHHHCYALDMGGERLCFTGDAAAMVVADIPATRYVSLPAPPPEFDLDTWIRSIDRLRNEKFDALMLTHFGRVDEVNAHLDAVEQALRDHATCISDLIEQGLSRDEVLAQYREWLLERGRAALSVRQIRQHITPSLTGMNVTGITRWHEQGNRP